MSFSELGLSEPLALAATAAGYTSATSIQSQAIPVLLEGRDLVGCSQTGTGKTAAFAMPLLQRIDLSSRTPQLLVLAPTRELATQVADSFREYGAQLPGLGVLPIFGGAAYAPQLSALRRGVHVIVGTPGRVIDHIKQGSLDLSGIRALVLDEADEMLQMGFIDDVRLILSQAPKERQIALFSATMPAPIRQIAREYLRDPVELKAAARERDAETITQQYILVPTAHKLEVLARVLEAESTDGVIVFVRTKTGTVEVAEHLAARGFRTAALNGDIVQTQRQRTVNQLKQGDIDVLVATDVAARGLDVDRISHVINYDLPREHEAYVHRIGRTGRAGRAGRAISLLAPGARRTIAHFSRAIGQPIEPIDPPSVATINATRANRFKQELVEALNNQQLKGFAKLLGQLSEETGESIERLAAAAAVLAHSGRPLFAEAIDTGSSRPSRHDGRPDNHHDRPQRSGHRLPGWQSYRVEVGRKHGIQPKHLVGAIANEAGLDGRDIGRIEIAENFSIVDLPHGMPAAVFELLRDTQVSGRALRISEADSAPRSSGGASGSGKRFSKHGAHQHPAKTLSKFGKKFAKKKTFKKKDRAGV